MPSIPSSLALLGPGISTQKVPAPAGRAPPGSAMRSRGQDGITGTPECSRRAAPQAERSPCPGGVFWMK